MLNDILVQQFWYMENTYVKQFLDNVQQTNINNVLSDEQVISAIDLMQEAGKEEIKPYIIKDGIATIKMHGPLMKKVSPIVAFFFGIRSMEQIGNEYQMALEDKDVAGIMLDSDSPGGSVDGTALLADIVYSGRGQKPTMTFANGAITSAAYWIGTGTDYIAIADKTTRSGSIGVVGVHQEYSEMAKKIGIRIHVFSSGKFKKIGNSFEKLSKDDVKYIDSQFKYLHNLFIEGVSKNLGIPKNRIPKDAREAKVFIGQEGVDAGLVDAIMNRNEAYAKLRAVIDGKDSFDKKQTINIKGGEQEMDLEAKIAELEKQLKDKDAEIQAFNSDKAVADFQEKITVLEAEKTDLETKIETLESEIAQLKADKESLSALSEIGKSAIDELKTDIKKLSVAVKGNDYDESFVDKQLKAFGNDYSYLVAMKTDLENQQAKLFKKGDLIPDESKTEPDKKTEEIDIGRKIGQANSPKIIKIK